MYNLFRTLDKRGVSAPLPGGDQLGSRMRDKANQSPLLPHQPLNLLKLTYETKL